MNLDQIPAKTLAWYVQLAAHPGWKADNSEKFWWLLGLDQYLHALTYIFLAWKFT